MTDDLETLFRMVVDLLNHDPDLTTTYAHNSEGTDDEKVSRLMAELYQVPEWAWEKMHRWEMVSYLQKVVFCYAPNHGEDGKPAAVDPTLPTLSKIARDALLQLNKTYPSRCTLDDLDNSGPYSLSRPTASKAIRELIELGYAERPDGKHSPAGITPLGLQVAKQLNG